MDYDGVICDTEDRFTHRWIRLWHHPWVLPPSMMRHRSSWPLFFTVRSLLVVNSRSLQVCLLQGHDFGHPTCSQSELLLSIFVIAQADLVKAIDVPLRVVQELFNIFTVDPLEIKFFTACNLMLPLASSFALPLMQGGLAGWRIPFTAPWRLLAGIATIFEWLFVRSLLNYLQMLGETLIL